jgi:site-specific recombinase XerD
VDAPHPSPHTRRAYESDLGQFLAHAGIEAGAWEQLAAIRPEHVAAWRDALTDDGQTNSSIRRKLRALTTASERGSDIVDLQDFAGHADLRTTLT